MSEFTDLLERARERFPAPDLPVERVVGRRERQMQKQRIAAVVLALALVVAGVGAAVSVARDEHVVSPGGAGIAVPGEGSCNARSPADPCWDTDIFVTSADGSGVVTRLGVDEGRDLAYSWSPDGERIAFLHAVEDTRDADISTMAADGSDVRRLTDEPGVDAFPTYSPDGTKIAFQSDRAGKVDIYVMDADGSKVVRLTDFDDDQRDGFRPDVVTRRRADRVRARRGPARRSRRALGDRRRRLERAGPARPADGRFPVVVARRHADRVRDRVRGRRSGSASSTSRTER